MIENMFVVILLPIAFISVIFTVGMIIGLGKAWKQYRVEKKKNIQ